MRAPTNGHGPVWFSKAQEGERCGKSADGADVTHEFGFCVSTQFGLPVNQLPMSTVVVFHDGAPSARGSDVVETGTDKSFMWRIVAVSPTTRREDQRFFVRSDGLQHTQEPPQGHQVPRVARRRPRAPSWWHRDESVGTVE